jgi:hypothetical protein
MSFQHANDDLSTTFPDSIYIDCLISVQRHCVLIVVKLDRSLLTFNETLELALVSKCSFTWSITISAPPTSSSLTEVISGKSLRLVMFSPSAWKLEKSSL